MTEDLSLAAAAAQLQTTPLNILLHVKRGELRGAEGPDGWRIEPASLHELLVRRAQGEPVSVCRRGCGSSGGCGSACG